MNKQYNWQMVFALTMIPMVGLIGTSIYIYFYGVVWQEPVITFIGWWITGLGITFGYHRLFAHRSFKAHPTIQAVAMLSGTAALQNTILKWSSDHRTHHKKLDTEEDPYSITKGFLHAHIGWILDKKHREIQGVHDLRKNPIVRFQHKHYWSLAIGLSFVLPLLIGAVYGRPLGGLLWGGFLRITLVHHFTFLINSLCHYRGKRPFEPESTAGDSWWVAFFTFGEGFHNFHHKFQWDYRNGIRWYDFDPCKWTINVLSYLGLTKDIRKAEEYQILHARMLGLKNNMKSYYPKLTEGIQKLYQLKVQELQDKAKEIYDSWQKMEKEFHSKKGKQLKNKFQMYVLKQNRKSFRTEYAAVLSKLTLLSMTVENGNDIVATHITSVGLDYP